MWHSGAFRENDLGLSFIEFVDALNNIADRLYPEDQGLEAFRKVR